MLAKCVSRNASKRRGKRTYTFTISVVITSVLFLTACVPSDRTPGLWLNGNVIEFFPNEWKFTDSHREIFVQVHTPYFLPHSVTIWCAQAHGDLYIAARDPDTKRWVGWLSSDNEIRLKIGDDVYDVVALEINDENSLEVAAAAYRDKYDLGEMNRGKNSTLKYWRISPRS